jgi:hypothetical protein
LSKQKCGVILANQRLKNIRRENDIGKWKNQKEWIKGKLERN